MYLIQALCQCQKVASFPRTRLYMFVFVCVWFLFFFFFFKKLHAIFKLQSDLSRQLRSRYSFLFWAGGIDFGGKIPAYWGQSNFWFSDYTLPVWLGYSSQHNHQKGCAHKIKWKFQRQTVDSVTWCHSRHLKCSLFYQDTKPIWDRFFLWS